MAVARQIEKVVPSTSAAGGKLNRLIGTLDFRGQGTNHALSDVEPFVLFDEAAVLSGKGMPPFGMHPHAHLIAMTVVTGGEWEDSDSVGGHGPHTHTDGSLYMAQAGSGISHMECTATEGDHSSCQVILKMQRDKWNDPPEVCRLKPGDVPVVKAGDADARVLVGSLGDAASPATVSGLPDCLLTRVTVPGSGTATLPIDGKHTRGWLFVRSGAARAASAGGGAVELTKASGLALFGEGGSLTVANNSPAEPLEFLVGAAAPTGEPWVKLLGHNGFVLGTDEADAEASMAKVVAEHPLK